MRTRNVLILVIILLIILGFALFRGHYFGRDIETRAAMDIGSGTTNIKIGQVDVKDQKILSILFEQRVPISFQKSLELSSDETFDASIQEQGIQALKRLKKIATDDYRVKKVVAVATAAFRQAKNGEQYANEIKEQTGIDIYILPHAEEGYIAYLGAVAETSVDPNKVIVWDIGGGSFQLTTMDNNGELYVEKGTKASVSFKNYIIEKIQQKNINETHTPNPMTKDQMDEALAYAERLADQVDPFIKQKIKQQGTEILGVGNLFYYGIRPLVGDKTKMTRSELKEAVMRLANKTDDKLGNDPFVDVKISNGLLVLGFMNALDINKVVLVDINNADGALVYPQFWESR